MRLDRVYIDGYKNLEKAAIDFDEQPLTTVVIGQNGTGKSNLIEAIIRIFRHFDLNLKASECPQFKFEVQYHLDEHIIKLSNIDGPPSVFCDDKKITQKAFKEDRSKYFPDLIFGYYSGSNRRVEELFDAHQRRYYNQIKTNENQSECQQAREDRRLFYCRPIHGIFSLLSFFAFPKPTVSKLLKEKLFITKFHSSLTVFHQPWFSKATKKDRLEKAHDLWGAQGPAGACGRAIQEKAFHPLALEANPIDDYRDKGGSEAQLGAFFRDLDTLKSFASNYADDQELFSALEAMDISDLVRDLHLWVERTDDKSGNISFSDLSDGERQLLMVLGLIRISRGKRALFLLDEPDTHLNPHWQHSYLDLIQEWTEITADETKCQIVMASHNPLTISALKREEVRVMSKSDGKLTIAPPYTDPQGLGFTATLTEIFGIPTTLDPETQKTIDSRNELASKSKRSDEEESELIKINDQLNRLGFMFENREPLYQDFLQSWKETRYADIPPFTPEQIAARRDAMKILIKKLSSEEGGAV